jgi:hypothetical protein
VASIYYYLARDVDRYILHASNSGGISHDDIPVSLIARPLGNAGDGSEEVSPLGNFHCRRVPTIIYLLKVESFRLGILDWPI